MDLFENSIALLFRLIPDTWTQEERIQLSRNIAWAEKPGQSGCDLQWDHVGSYVGVHRSEVAEETGLVSGPEIAR
jgi:hypothetical protein